MKKRQSLAKLFENNQFLKIFALAAAIILYISVAMTTKGTIDYTVRSVPVNLDLQSANLTNLRLNIIGETEFFVDVKIRGERTVVPKYEAQSPLLAATARIGNISEPGEYELDIVPAYQNPDELPFEIVEYYPKKITLTLDRMLTKTLPVIPVIKGVSTAPGYIWNSEDISPSKVVISGPESEVSKIMRAEAVLELNNEEITSSLSRQVPIVLQDEQGEILEQDHLKLETTDAHIIISVLKETSLPLEVDFLNLPPNFPVDELLKMMKRSEEYIEVAGPASVIDSLTEITLGPIDLKTLTPTHYNFTLPLGLDQISAELQAQEGITNVHVSFDTDQWQTETFYIEKVEARNIPSEYTVEVITDNIADVHFVGTADALAGMTADDILAVVDLSDRELTPGKKTYPVKISAPSRGLAWATGNYNVVVNIVKKEEN